MDKEMVMAEVGEREIGGEVNSLSAQVESLVIDSMEKNIEASALLRTVKTMQSRIKAFWKPLIQKAKEPYDDLCARQKAMLDPVAYSEKVLKMKLDVYDKEQKEIARQKALEEAQRKQAEIDKKMAEAAELEANGNLDDADYALAEAELLSDLSPEPVVESTPKVDGLSYTTRLVLDSIEIVDPSAVPVVFDGVEIRPVDKSAILRLAKAHKGNIEIPGVKITPKTVISARSY